MTSDKIVTTTVFAPCQNFSADDLGKRLSMNGKTYTIASVIDWSHLTLRPRRWYDTPLLYFRIAWRELRNVFRKIFRPMTLPHIGPEHIGPDES